MPDRLNDLINWAENTFTAEKYPEVAEAFESLVAQARDSFVEWTQNEFFAETGRLYDPDFARRHRHTENAAEYFDWHHHLCVCPQ